MVLVGYWIYSGIYQSEVGNRAYRPSKKERMKTVIKVSNISGHPGLKYIRSSSR